MKKISLFTFLLTISSFLCVAQQGRNLIYLDNETITVADNWDGDIDVTKEHTIEMWIKPTSNTGDQKIFNKITSAFKDGYILGYTQGKIIYEVFDADNVYVLNSNPLPPNVWMHVAVTCRANDKMKIYINGELDVERVIGDFDPSYNTSDLVIGAASWFTTTKQTVSYVDEIRYWHSDLDEATIKKYMHLEVDANHPNASQMRLYLKLDEIGNGFLDDHSYLIHNDDFRYGNIVRTTGTLNVSDLPFVKNQSWENPIDSIAGIWRGKEVANLDKVTITGVDFSNGQSSILEPANVDDGTYCSYESKSPLVDKTNCYFWKMTHQNRPKLQFSIDLARYDLSNVSTTNIVLMESVNFASFDGCNIIQGNLDGAIFTTNNFVAQSDSAYYQIGFIDRTASSSDKAVPLSTFSISPNPSQGILNLELDFRDAKISRIALIDVNGREVMSENLGSNTSTLKKSYNLAHLPTGLYHVRVYSEEGITTKKVLIH